MLSNFRPSRSNRPALNCLTAAVLGAAALFGAGCALPSTRSEPDLWHRVATAEAAEDWSRAAELRMRLLDEAGETRVEHFLACARALERAGEPEAGLSVLEEGLGLPPCPILGPLDPVLLRGERARLLVELGFCRAAEGEWLQALNADPNAGRAWFELGCCRLRLERAVEAAEAFDRALQAGFRVPVTYAKAAKAQRLLGRPARAHELYVEAIEESPNAPLEWLLDAAANHIELPASQVAGNDLQAALNWARTCVVEWPNRADVHFVLGVLEERGGEDALARTTYRRAVELEPSHLGALTHLGRLSARMAMDDEAREMIGRALAIEDRPARRGDLQNLLASL